MFLSQKIAALSWWSPPGPASGLIPMERFDRPGRATIVCHESAGTWLGVHSHLSLNRGVPQTSHGDRPPVKAH